MFDACGWRKTPLDKCDTCYDWLSIVLSGDMGYSCMFSYLALHNACN